MRKTCAVLRDSLGLELSPWIGRMRSALLRLQELEKRLGQALLGRQCKDCGANPCSDLFAEVNGPIEPMLCERCEVEQALPKQVNSRH